MMMMIGSDLQYTDACSSNVSCDHISCKLKFTAKFVVIRKTNICEMELGPTCQQSEMCGSPS